MPLYFAHRHLQLRREEAEELQRRLEELARQQTAREEAQATDEHQRIGDTATGGAATEKVKT